MKTLAEIKVICEGMADNDILSVIKEENEDRLQEKALYPLTDIIMNPVYTIVSYAPANDDKAALFEEKSKTVSFSAIYRRQVGKDTFKAEEDRARHDLNTIDNAIREYTANEKVKDGAIAEIAVALNTWKEENNLYIPLLSVNLTAKTITESPAKVQNKHIRVLILDRARAKKSLEGIRSFRYADMVDIVCRSLSTQYLTNQDFIKKFS